MVTYSKPRTHGDNTKQHQKNQDHLPRQIHQKNPQNPGLCEGLRTGKAAAHSRPAGLCFLFCKKTNNHNRILYIWKEPKSNRIETDHLDFKLDKTKKLLIYSGHAWIQLQKGFI